MLEFERYDGVVCNVFLVDSEGLPGDPDSDIKKSKLWSHDNTLFFVARTLSQIAMFHLDEDFIGSSSAGGWLRSHKDLADVALLNLSPGVRKATQTVQYFVTLRVRL